MAVGCQVKGFEHDGAWDFQLKPPGTGEGSGMEDYQYWTANGMDASGVKTEHNSPDPRPGYSAFIQSSCAGYFGHNYVHESFDTLMAAMQAGDDFPAMFEGSYFVYQGELDVTSQIELGGKGQYADGKSALMNYDNWDGGKVTFEDIDGFEVFEGQDGKLYCMFQEDSGSDYGERMFITGPLEHDADGVELTYYFVAMSGGSHNTRMMAGVGIPAGTNCHSGGHEFSGLFDISGFLVKDDSGDFVLSASDFGDKKRMADAMVHINDKIILVGLQSHNLDCGIIEAFHLDRGGQWLLYQPNLPVD